MKQLIIALGALMVSSVATADRAQHDAEREYSGPQSKITIQVNGLSCATAAGSGAFDARSWTWGATNAVSSSGGGAGTGKVSISNLAIKKAFDGCSSALFGAVAQGRHFPSLILTDTDASGVVVATLTLSDVFVTSWSVGSSIHEATPDESVAFVFRRACLSGSGSTQICYDTATGMVN